MFEEEAMVRCRRATDDGETPRSFGDNPLSRSAFSAARLIQLPDDFFGKKGLQPRGVCELYEVR